MGRPLFLLLAAFPAILAYGGRIPSLTPSIITTTNDDSHSDTNNKE
jgi:hypothetical protein